ncbi:MAG: valine--tRNA ligase [Actinobacteria bacterium]|nr:valine--tRNA ligase [Actinomycetota bacterium]
MAEVTMAARYSPHEVEQRIMKEWLDRSAFHAEADGERESYCIVIPPPNVTGSLHMGHALNGTLQDILIRYHHMRGKNTFWLVGTDHAGIATQNKVEAQLAEEGLRKKDLGREAFERRVWAWKEKYGSTIIHQLKKLGCACDYERERFTMDQAYHDAVLRVFVALYEKGDIYRDVYLVNWCVRCGSALSDLEVEHLERADKLYYIKYPVLGTGDFLTVATTRPETMLGDTAVAVNPKDPRYSRYVGMKALVPLAEREVPIIADEHVDPEFGTGALKITPGHDPNDWEIGRRHGLPAVSVIGFDGRMNEEAGDFAGMDVDAARGAVVDRLAGRGLFVEAEDYIHAVGTCYRCGTVIQPLLSLQWFMDMKRLAAPAIEVVEQGKVRFFPERWTDVYLEWMRGIRPWCLSRQLWWGHRLPVWYCEECGHVIVTLEAPAVCPACGGPVHRDEDVLDTWFSSAMWPFATLGWPERTPELEVFYPTAVLSTARDILYLWVARMIMMGLEFAGDIPFRHVIVHPTILAADGRRMSKSLGTGVDPLELIEEYGADATRFGLVYMSSVQDVRFSPERIEMGRNFANKIWNASRLVLQGAHPQAGATVTLSTPADRWIFSRLNQVTRELADLYERYDFAEIARVLYRFVWNEMCDWYLEVGKARLYSESQGERLEVSGNLLVLLERVMGLLHPLMPFVSEEVYRNLPHVRARAERGGAPSLFDSRFPEADAAWDDPAAERAMEVFAQVVSGLRSARDELAVPREAEGRVWLVTSAPGAAAGLVEQPRPLRLLAGCTLAGVVATDEEVPAGRYATVEAPGVKALLALEGFIDVEKERTRLLGRAEKARGEIDRARTKLDNPGFVSKAPAAVVAEMRARLAQAEATLRDVARQYRERVGEDLPR